MGLWEVFLLTYTEQYAQRQEWDVNTSSHQSDIAGMVNRESVKVNYWQWIDSSIILIR